MEQLNQLITKIASQPDAIDDNDLAALARACREYPASAVPPALLLKYGGGRLSEADRDLYRRRVALLGGDRAALIRAIDPSGRAFGEFYPPEPTVKKPPTANAIDTFLDTYGHRSPEEDALLERMIFNPVPDYSQTLARTEAPAGAAAPGTPDSLIDAFLASNPDDSTARPKPSAPAPTAAPEPQRSPQQAAPAADALLSESLAKIFIKQGRYDRAYEIISNLNLNYPEKSVYFADQLRFLRKLMIARGMTLPG